MTSTANEQARAERSGGRPPATGWRLRVPNTLTCIRLVLAVACFVLLALCEFDLNRYPGPAGTPTALLLAAMAVFIIAAVTDAADGYFARRWNAITKFGRVVDPFADKILVLGSFVLLTSRSFLAPAADGQEAHLVMISGIEGWMVIVILGRELLVTSLRGLVESQGGDFSAGWAGKVKMIVQSVSIPAILLTLALADNAATGPMRVMIVAIAWTVTLVTAASAVPYIVKATKALR